MSDFDIQVDGPEVAATLRGFGHGWQGQHNSTNAVVQSTWGYDEYNDAINTELHHSLRAGTRQSNGVLQLFEPMSMREENWTESDVKNALRAGASKSSHAVVGNKPEDIEEKEMSEQKELVVRRLTPSECEMLMGWDAGWCATGIDDDGNEVKMADTHRYKMCGNGVVANVSEWFGVRYEEAKRNAATND